MIKKYFINDQKTISDESVELSNPLVSSISSDVNFDNTHNLQHSVGNTATLRMHGYGERVQRKSVQETNNDPYEQEADAFANQLIEETAPSMKLSSISASIQRSSADTSSTTPTPAITSTEEPATVSETTPTPGLIVDDSATELASGQMRKSEFLSQLRTAVTQTAEAALSGTIWSAMGCPWIDHWFGYYDGRDSVSIERAIRNYAPESSTATSAKEYIPFICTRVCHAIETWSTTGEITGVPEGVSTGLPNAQDKLQTKSRDGNLRNNMNPAVVKSQLGTGHSLDAGTRSSIECVYGTSVSDVQVHTDDNAAKIASQINARAFTVGNHIAFDSGEYRPGTLIGDALIAHEVAHTLQQRGAAMNTAMKEYENQDSDMETDADQAAIEVLKYKFTNNKNSMPSFFSRSFSGLRLSRCSNKIKYGSSFRRTVGNITVNEELMSRSISLSREAIDRDIVNDNIVFNSGARSPAEAHLWSTAYSIRQNQVTLATLQALPEGKDMDGNEWYREGWTMEDAIRNAESKWDGARADEGYRADDPRRAPNTPDVPVSHHTMGEAVDITVPWRNGDGWHEEANTLVSAHNLKRPIAKERWHFEREEFNESE